MANIIIMPFKALSDRWCFMERSIVIMEDIAPAGDARHAVHHVII